ncbi:MAG: hypothetical protein LUE65_06645, partial [Clostridiales bacterium]|nr:hypothetical protein [Clostridiales bacterium]
PQFSVEEELKNGSLLRLETELDDKPYPGVIVFHKNRWISPQMELAFRILQDQIEVDYDKYTGNAI